MSVLGATGNPPQRASGLTGKLAPGVDFRDIPIRAIDLVNPLAGKSSSLVRNLDLFAIEHRALDHLPADPEGRKFAIEKGFQRFRLARGDQRGEAGPRPALLHLNRSQSDIERSGFHRQVGHMCQQLTGDIVEIGLERDDPFEPPPRDAATGQKNAQDVGNSEFTGSRPIPNFFEDEPRRQTGLGTESAQDRRPGRGRQFTTDPGFLEYRILPQQKRGGRGGNRENPVLTAGKAGPEMDRGNEMIGDPEIIETDRHAHDVGNRIPGPDFMEMDRFGGRAMDPGLGFGQHPKDGYCTLFGTRGNRRRLDQCADIGKTAVGQVAKSSVVGLEKPMEMTGRVVMCMSMSRIV